VVCPFEDKRQGIPLKRYLFGPYTSNKEALENLEKLNGLEVVSLPTGDLDEAVRILNG